MGSFWTELKRRKVVQVAAVYAVVAWLLIEVAATIEEPLSLPGWFDTIVIVLLAIGFPIAVILSWAFDVTPGGIVRAAGTTEAASRSRLIEIGFVSLLVLAIGFFLLNEIAFDGGPQRLPNSVGVLPFDNLSPDANNAAYADGFHETILTELAKIQDMTVIARTTMERYRNSTLTLAEIADELNVETIMEGSFQLANDDVRITAQLIDPATGAHLWTENYDGPFDDIFEIQSSIATSIALALEAQLLPDERRRLEASPTTSPEAFQLYLRAAAISNGPDVEPSLRATAHTLLDRAIALDPMFGDAYAQKARYYDANLSFDPIPASNTEAYLQSLVQAVNDSAERAIELNSDSILSYTALADVTAKQLRATEARGYYDQAVALAPNNADARIERSWLDLYVGDFLAALPRAERAVELSPSDPTLRERLAMVYWFAGELDASIEQSRLAIDLGSASGTRYLTIAGVEFRRGNTDAAREALSLAERLIPETQYPLSLLAFSFALTGDSAAAERVFERLQAHSAQFHVDDLGWTMAYLAIGDRAEALRHLEAEAASEFVDGSSTHRALMAANAWGAPVLDEPEFAALRARLFLQY